MQVDAAHTRWTFAAVCKLKLIVCSEIASSQHQTRRLVTGGWAGTGESNHVPSTDSALWFLFLLLSMFGDLFCYNICLVRMVFFEDDPDSKSFEDYQDW